MAQDPPFVWGAQYYRAPTPEPQCWADDFARMKQLGFNSVGFLVQWRWAHRAADRFYYEDLDPLMDLAGQHELKVMLGLAMDVAPLWLYYKYPDARQVTVSGAAIQQHATARRPIGGVPGPCYNHPGALVHRQDFVAAMVEHFKNHAAMGMWDVCAEGNKLAASRFISSSHGGAMVCYCHHCREKFIAWLKNRYKDRDTLNGVWGRCYEEWHEIEVPRSGEAIADFIDWREFQLDTIAAEAKWRAEMVRERDPEHAVLAGREDVPVIAGPSLGELLARIGGGAKGLVFERFRPEVLGVESAVGGLVNLDGSDRPETKAAGEFWKTIEPHVAVLLKCRSRPAEIGIWKSRKNEIYHQAMHGSTRGLTESIERYTEILYWNSHAARMVSGQMLEAGQLGGLKLLIMPACDCLAEAEARALDAWVRGGGVLLCEGRLGGYDATTGRHSRKLPGCGLAEAWGIAAEGAHADAACLVSRSVGRGQVYYYASNLAAGARKDDSELWHLLEEATARAGVKPAVQVDKAGAVHVDVLEDERGEQFLVVANRSKARRMVNVGGTWRGLFSGARWKAEEPVSVEGGFADLLRREDEAASG